LPAPSARGICVEFRRRQNNPNLGPDQDRYEFWDSGAKHSYRPISPQVRQWCPHETSLWGYREPSENSIEF